jgi:hypothetical protein
LQNKERKNNMKNIEVTKEKMEREGNKRDVHRPKGKWELIPTIPTFNMELILGIK